MLLASWQFGLKCKWSEIQPLYQLSTLVNTRHVTTRVSEESELCGLVCVPLNGRSFSLSSVNALYLSVLLESGSHHYYQVLQIYCSLPGICVKPSNPIFPVSPEVQWLYMRVSNQLLWIPFLWPLVDLYSWMFHAKSFKTSCMKIQFVLLNNIVTVNEQFSAERKKNSWNIIYMESIY